MNLTHKSNHSLTLKRRRGRRNLKHSVDNGQDSLGEPSDKPAQCHISQRPSSSGSAYLGCPPEPHNQRLLSEEPFSHLEDDTSGVGNDDNTAEPPELLRSMTEDLLVGTSSASSTMASTIDNYTFPEWWSDYLENPELPDLFGSSNKDITDSSSVSEHWQSPTPFSSISNTAAIPSSERAAVHRLPNELLTLIFEQGSCFASQRMFELKYPLIPVQPINTISFMLTVLHTCSRWREVAIHTPALWTSLLVARPRSLDPEKLLDMKDYQKPMDWVAKAIKRSQTLPLDITIDCSNISPAPVIKQLIPESYRWRSLSIMVPCIQSLPLVISSLRDVNAPILESFEITSNKLHTGPIPEELPPFFESTPKLKYMRLNRVYLQWDASPLNHLTTLELRFIVWPDFHELRHIFLQSPTLEHLVLHFDINAFANLDRQGRAPIPIPCLRSLELRFFYESSQNVVPLIQLFNIPTLESLTLRDFSCADWCRVLPYFRSYSASYPVLRSLTVSNIKGLIYVDSSTVRAFPHLTSLSVTGVYSNAFSSLLLDERTNDGYNALVWPKLRCLRIEKDVDMQVELVEKAVEARKKMGRPIERLVLDQQVFYMQPKAVERLKLRTRLENAAYARE